MRRLLLFLLLCGTALGQAPIVRQAFTTNATSVTANRVVIANGSGVPGTPLANGANGTVLGISNGVPAYLNNPAQVWTNDAGTYRLIDYPTNVAFTPIPTSDNYVLGYANLLTTNGFGDAPSSVRIFGHGNHMEAGIDNYLVGYDNSISNSHFEVFIVGDNNHIKDDIVFVMGADNAVDTGIQQNTWIVGNANHAETGSQGTIFLGRYNTNRSAASGILGRDNMITASSGNSYFIGEANSMGSTGNNHAYSVGFNNVIDQGHTFGIGQYLHQNGVNHVLIGSGTDANNLLASQTDNSVEMGFGTVPQVRVDSDGLTVASGVALMLSGTTNQYTDDGTQLLRNLVPIPTSTATITLQNKTVKSAADGGNNTIKLKNYIVLAFPHSCDGAGAVISTNDNTLAYAGQAAFSGTAATNGNYVEYRLTVPEDVDTAVDMKVERWKFRLGAADTAAQTYNIGMASVADSASYDSPTIGQWAALSFAGDASGVSGDVETVSNVTLTGWRTNVTAGRLWVIRVNRDGGDASTQTSYSGPLVISYGSTQ